MDHPCATRDESRPVCFGQRSKRIMQTNLALSSYIVSVPAWVPNICNFHHSASLTGFHTFRKRQLITILQPISSTKMLFGHDRDSSIVWVHVVRLSRRCRHRFLLPEPFHDGRLCRTCLVWCLMSSAGRFLFSIS